MQEKTGNTFYLCLSAVKESQETTAMTTGAAVAAAAAVAASLAANKEVVPATKEDSSKQTSQPRKQEADRPVRSMTRDSQEISLRRGLGSSRPEPHSASQQGRSESREPSFSFQQQQQQQEDETRYAIQVEVFGVEEVGAEITDQLREVPVPRLPASALRSSSVNCRRMF